MVKFWQLALWWLICLLNWDIDLKTTDDTVSCMYIVYIYIYIYIYIWITNLSIFHINVTMINRIVQSWVIIGGVPASACLCKHVTLKSNKTPCGHLHHNYIGLVPILFHIALTHALRSLHIKLHSNDHWSITEKYNHMQYGSAAMFGISSHACDTR